MEYTLATAVGDLFVVTQQVDTPFARGDALDAALAAHGAVVIPLAT